MRTRITSVRTATATLAVGCSLFAASGPMAATAFAEPNTSVVAVRNRSNARTSGIPSRAM